MKPAVTGVNICPLYIFPVIPCERTDTHRTQKQQPRGIFV